MIRQEQKSNFENGREKKSNRMNDTRIVMHNHWRPFTCVSTQKFMFHFCEVILRLFL